MNLILNEKQQEVINSSGPVLCIAGAGTGKTRVLTEKIYKLIKDGVDHKDIYAFTFTNKAAHEMKSRVAELTHTFSSVTISTFHSFFFSELLTLYDQIGFDENISIIDQEDKMKIIREIIKDNNLEILDSLAYKSISNIKNHIPNKDLSLKEEVETAIIFKKLQAKLREINRMDFDDILYYYYELIQSNDYYLESMQDYFQYVLIDEAQDINQIQYSIINLLAKKSKLFMMVGDIDQCIYTFRGSNYSLIKRFQDEHHAKLIVLEENYRCTKSILNAANNLIKNNVDRFDKDLYTNNDKTFKLNFFLAKTDKDEACYSANLITKLLENGYKHEDICVLYRNNQLSVNLEKELTIRKIPFTLHGSHPFFSHKEIKSLINHYLFLLNHDDSFALSMIINYPNKLLKEKSLTELNKLQSSSKKPLYELIKESKDPEVVELLSYLQELIDHFEELNHVDFFNYLINKIKLFDAFKEEKNVKAKTARVLEFKTFIQELSDTNKKEALKEFIDNIYLQNTSDKTNKDSISMMTIHQSKGLEYKVIIILGCNQGILPSSKTKMLNNEEERRIFYVAITRAKERLFLVAADRRFINGKYQIYAPSDFLLEMGL